jgi:hypothetical protein
MSKPLEYLCQIDSGVIPTIDTQWTITSPGLIVWNPEINPSTELISLIDGGLAQNTPYIIGADGFQWTWSISDVGIITITSSTTPLAGGTITAGLTESATVEWVFIVGLDGQLYITSDNILENKYYYPAIQISFVTSDASDKFELYAIKPNTTRHRR